jgi:predicted phage terminase large subunit-like protein
VPRALILRKAYEDKQRFGQVLIELPQDPAQAGKDQAEQLVAMLSGYSVRAKLQSGAKSVRASGLSSQQLIGHVMLPEDAKAVYPDGKRGESVPWVGPLTFEYSQFDTGDHDDQVDAGADAFNRLAGRGSRLIS